MKKLIDTIITLMVISKHFILVSTTCPKQCRCYSDSQKIKCGYKDISEEQLINITSNIDRTTKHLYLMGNQLKDIPLESLKYLNQLETLSLNNNKLQRVPNHLFKYLPNLKELHLTGNQITKLTNISGLQNLTSLYLNSNNISVIPDNIFKSTNKLKELYLNNNQITNINKNTFSGLYNMKLILLDNNFVQNIHPDAFHDTVNLEELRLQANYLRNLPTNLFISTHRLKTIYLQENRIENISESIFDGLQIEKLFLNTNKFLQIPENLFSNVRRIKKLYLHDNPLICSCNLLKTFNKYKNNIANVDDTVSWGTCQNQNRDQIKINHLTKENLYCNACELVTCSKDTVCMEVKNSTEVHYKCKQLTSGTITTADKNTTRGTITTSDKNNTNSFSNQTEPEGENIFLIVALVSIGVLIIFIVVILWFLYQKRKQKFLVEETMCESLNSLDDSVGGTIKLESLKRKRVSIKVETDYGEGESV